MDPDYQNAEDFPVTSQRDGFLPKIASDQSELWVGVPVFFTRYDPLAEIESANVAGRTRAVYRWRDSNWTRFKSQYLQRVRSFWDRSFELRVAGSPRGLPASTPRTIRCRLDLWEVQDRASGKLKPLVFELNDPHPIRLPPGVAPILEEPEPWTSHETSACGFFGRAVPERYVPLNYRDRGISSILDSNDLEPRTLETTVAVDARTARRVSTTQRPALHEMGHHLGLIHRCTDLRVRPQDSFRTFDIAQPDRSHRSENDRLTNGAFVHDTAAADSRRRDDEYCRASNNEDAFKDLMACGEDLHDWHGALWRFIIGEHPSLRSVPYRLHRV